jgi:hypothetical protein
MPGSKKCVSCIPTNKKVASTTKKRADWKTKVNLTSIFPNDIVPNLKGIKMKVPEKANQSVEVKLGKKNANKIVLFYAAEDSPSDSCSECQISKPINAYKNFKNQGISQLDSNGNAILKMRCPMVYRENNTTYQSHVHIILSNSQKTEWVNKLYTQTVVCALDFKEMKKVVDSRCALVINALPFEYYVKDRIPNSVPLDHNLPLSKLNKKEVIDYLSLMLVHNPELHKNVKSGKLDLMDIPMVTYCYNESCEADLDLQQKLNKIGFTNVKVYTGGVVEWKKKYN